MDIKKTIDGLQPLHGKVIPIRTVQETSPPEDFGDAYVAEVNVKAASKVIKVLDSAFPRDPSLPQSHLRRFAKRELLPTSLRAAIEAKHPPSANPANSIFVVIAPPLPDVNKLKTLLAPFVPNATSSASPNVSQSSTDIPHEASASVETASSIHLFPIKVPLYPPSNARQAEKWTKSLWPVVFNPAATRGTVAPPPQILNRAQESIQPRAGYYLALARKVADEAEQSCRGRKVGAVIVDPAIEAVIESTAKENGKSTTDRWVEAVLAVGGDARYGRREAGALSQSELHPGVVPNPASATYTADVEGGPDLHALMRAIELVARRRREDNVHEMEIAAISNRTPMVAITSDPQLSTQLSPLESYFLYEADTTANTPTSAPKPLASPSSPKKRKHEHEEPTPETRDALLQCITNSTTQLSPTDSQLQSSLLPAPLPSATALAAASSHHSLQDPSNLESISSTETPVTTPVQPNSRIRTRSQGGYLCTDLDIYISHEPCLCCSMGMLLSRFRAVIFPRSGRTKSGGLASEPVVAPVADDQTGTDSQIEEDKDKDSAITGEERTYYGLHWRKELNWRALGFEFVEDEAESIEDASESMIFHA